MFNAQRWRRLWEAAKRDRREDRFWSDVEGAISTQAYTPEDFSIAELFEQFVESGHEIVRSWSPRHGGGRTGIQLYEAGVDTSAFANITGQVVFSQVLQVFQDPTLIGERLTRRVPTGFSGEKIPGIGRLGDMAESVAEGGGYPMAGLTEEWVETPETTKQGFIVPVTKEAIFFDRTGVLLVRASEVATWLAVNKEKRILDVVLGVTSTYRRNGVSSAVASYGDNSGNHDWDNLAASNALQDWTDIENALLLFDDIVDPNTGEPIISNPNQIVVPTALSFTAQRIVSATEIRQVTNTSTTTISSNPLRGGRTGGAQMTGPEILSNQYVKARSGSASTWWMGDFPKGFWYMENWPATSVQAPTNSEMEFTHDIVQRYKVSERGTPAAVEPRHAVESTA